MRTWDRVSPGLGFNRYRERHTTGRKPPLEELKRLASGKYQRSNELNIDERLLQIGALDLTGAYGAENVEVTGRFLCALTGSDPEFLLDQEYLGEVPDGANPLNHTFTISTVSLLVFMRSVFEDAALELGFYDRDQNGSPATIDPNPYS